MWDEHELSPVLTVISGPMQGASFRLGPGQRVIGRDDGADITIDDRKISRRHATVEVASGRALLTDAGSTNGTWVNERRVAEAQELRDGDRIRMGHVGLRYFDPSGAATDPVGALRYNTSRQELIMTMPLPGTAPVSTGGPAQNGSASNGSASNGSALNGSAANGSAANGSAQGGSAAGGPAAGAAVPGWAAPGAVGGGPAGAAAPAAASAAPMSLSEVMPTTGRPGRLLLTIGGCLAMAGWLTWAYLMW